MFVLLDLFNQLLEAGQHNLRAINLGNNKEVTIMKSIYKSGISCCTGFILNLVRKSMPLVRLYEINIASSCFIVSFCAR